MSLLFKLGSKGSSAVVACACLLLIALMPVSVQAEAFRLPNSDLEEIIAQGINTGGDLSTSCTTSSSSICLGTYEWNDNHQFDASDHKGAIDMDGYVQQNVTAQTVVNSTQSAVASGVNVIGNVSSTSGAAIDMVNTNNATNFIGGF